MYTPQQLLPNVYTLGYKAGQTASNLLYRRPHSWPSLREIYTAVTSFPGLYKEWWLNLFASDPIHVFVETTLLLTIAFILITSRRQKDWKARESQLTPAEEEELLLEWKLTRAPLTPASVETYDDEYDDDDDDDLQQDIVVHKLEGRTMQVEVGNSGTVQTVLNTATFDFLGLSSTEEPKVRVVKEAARAALDRYGCGSCGPRGFYGTIDVHLQLEQQMADFCGTEQAILYSDGASMCSSTVASFAKRGDLVVADEGIYEPLRTGVTLSRAHVKWFKHNDMADLRRVLESIQAKDRQLGRKPNQQRRFIVVEGLYKNRGTIVPLDELVRLKHEFCYRLILDESFSFGTLGKSGRGVVELYNKKFMYDAEIVTVGLENAMGSIGGCTIGTEEVVDHQRLSGSGYCFSASSPPFTATAAMASLKLLDEESEFFLQRLNDNRVYLYEKLRSWWCEKVARGVLVVTSDERSPIVVFQVANIPETEYLDRVVFFSEVVRESLARGVAFVATGQRHVRMIGVVGGHPGPAASAAHSGAAVAAASHNGEALPGLRMTVSAALTHADIDRALAVLGEAVDVVMNRFREESKE